MRKILKFINSEESGQGVVEYGLILALIVLAAIIGLNILSETTNSLYGEVVNKMP